MSLFSATLEILSIWVIYTTQIVTSDRKLDPQTQSPCGFTFSYTKFLRFCFPYRIQQNNYNYFCPVTQN